MGKRILPGISALLLVASVLLAVLWWVRLSKHEIPADWRPWAALAGLACLQLATILVLGSVLLRVKRVGSVAWMLGVAVLCFGFVCSNLLNGFTPAFGAPLGVVVLTAGLIGLAVTGRLKDSRS